MIKLDLYYAEVTDNNDEEKRAKLQIRILPEFKNMKESLLPWARPFMSSGFSTTEHSMKLPEQGSKIWVLTNDKFTYFRYLCGSPIEGLFNYDSIKSSLDTITELSDSAYPNIDFELLNDGSIRFNNRISGDMGVLHNTGTYSIIDTNGYVTVSEVSGNKTTLSATGILIVDCNGHSIEMTTAGVQFKTGDSSTWMPNTLPACLFTGAPHGGPTGGIAKLKGG